MSDQFSISDVLFLEEIGVDGVAVAERQPTARSDWTPERVMQAAADDQVQVYGLGGGRPDNEGVVRFWIDGRPATMQETDAITDLVISDHATFVGRQVKLTGIGRSTLARWARYRPCIRRDQRRDGGER